MSKKKRKRNKIPMKKDKKDYVIRMARISPEGSSQFFASQDILEMFPEETFPGFNIDYPILPVHGRFYFCDFSDLPPSLEDKRMQLVVEVSRLMIQHNGIRVFLSDKVIVYATTLDEEFFLELHMSAVMAAHSAL